MHLLVRELLSPHNALHDFSIVMVKDPESLERLQKKLVEVVGPDRLSESEDKPHLPTVRAIVKEEIRHRSVLAESLMPHKHSEKDDL